LIDTTHQHRKERRLVTECTSQVAYLLVAGVDVYDIEHSFRTGGILCLFEHYYFSKASRWWQLIGLEKTVKLFYPLKPSKG